LSANASIRPATLLALALTLVALVALPARSLAQTRNDSCTTAASATTHRGHQARSCAPARHTGAEASIKTKAKSKPRRHRHHHARRSKKGARRRRRTIHGTPEASQAAPTCQDGSAPSPAGNGTFTCDDGSQPTCQDGIAPVVAEGGSKLVCVAAAAAGEPGSEPVCEDGSLPALVTGSYACDDGSEPECEAGSAPVQSSEGSLLTCQPASESAFEGEARE
jgi:hypothetical protein